MTLGSLFDGIGGWLIAAKHAGVKPVWASEIDPFPAAVTAYHFPEVTQLGDITQIDVHELEPVDVICAGSPCQDLSVAGKRAGLEGERSGLFHTAIRLVHELRARTGKPRYFVWENVPGAFSSNRGADFRAVLEEISQTEIPMPENNKWAEAGMVEWDGGSLAWRTLDAQYWGVPQRRKRIFLVADFDGRSAGEILFVEQGLHGDSAESEGEREEAAGNARESADSASGFKYKQGAKAGGIGYQNGKAPTLELSQNCAIHTTGYDAYQHHNWRESSKLGPITTGTGRVRGDTPLVAYSFDSKASNSMKSKNPHSGCRQVEVSKTLDTTIPDPSKNQGGIAIYDMTHADEVMRPVHGDKSNCLNSRMGTGENQVPVVHCLNDQGGSVMDVSDKAGTLRAESHGHEPCVCIAGNIIDRQVQNGGNGVGAQEDISYTLNTVDRHAVAVGNGQMHQTKLSDKVGALNCMHDQQAVLYTNTVGALCADDHKGINSQYVDQGKCVIQKSVRRLTPTECERLQGLPDFYTLIDYKGKPAPDSKRYKALGNGMAQPCADWVIKRIVEAGC